MSFRPSERSERAGNCGAATLSPSLASSTQIPPLGRYAPLGRDDSLEGSLKRAKPNSTLPFQVELTVQTLSLPVDHEVVERAREGGSEPFGEDLLDFTQTVAP